MSVCTHASLYTYIGSRQRTHTRTRTHAQYIYSICVTALVGCVALVQLTLESCFAAAQLLVQAACLVPRPLQLLAQHGELALGLADLELEVKILLVLWRYQMESEQTGRAATRVSSQRAFALPARMLGAQTSRGAGGPDLLAEDRVDLVEMRLEQEYLGRLAAGPVPSWQSVSPRHFNYSPQPLQY